MTKRTKLVAMFILTPLSKTPEFDIGNCSNAVEHEVAFLQDQLNVVYSDSKSYFSGLGRSSRPPAIDFLVVFGSRTSDR